MGHSTNGSGQTFYTPDSTENTLYLMDYGVSYTLSEIVESAKNYFSGASFDELYISSEYIHTHYLGHDQYDPGDYTNYIVIRRAPKDE